MGALRADDAHVVREALQDGLKATDAAVSSVDRQRGNQKLPQRLLLGLVEARKNLCHPILQVELCKRTMLTPLCFKPVVLLVL